MEVNQEERRRSDGRIPAFFLAILIAAIIALFYGVGSTDIGFAVLLAIPAALGGLITSAVDPDGKLPPMGCFMLPTVAILFLIGLSVLLFREGAVCVAMILPLWLPAAITGAIVNRYIVWKRQRVSDDDANFLSAGWLVLPALVLSLDTVMPAQWQTEAVERSTVIAAPPERIWPLLNRLPHISAKEGTANFTQDILGIPRPSSAVIVGRDGVSVRKASWGENIRFEEVIEHSIPDRSLTWRFAFPDDSLQRHTDNHISPDGETLKIHTGSYELVKLVNGTTKLTLRTEYEMKARMTPYLRFWGELMLGDIQENVLAIIKQRAER